MRKMRKYRLWCEDGGSKDVEAPNLAAAVERLKRWVRGRDWGDEGARVWGEVTRLRGGRLIEDETATVTVEIEPDHTALMRRAGAPPDCDHEWSSEGGGGCTENPGVWGGKGMVIFHSAHCIHCGLQRVVQTTDSQRNRYEHDTVKYRMPSSGELAEMRAEGMVEPPDAE